MRSCSSSRPSSTRPSSIRPTSASSTSPAPARPSSIPDAGSGSVPGGDPDCADAPSWSPQQRLQGVVDVLADPDGSRAPVAVGVTWLHGEIELALMPLEPGDLLDVASRLQIPSALGAFGVVTPGTATSLRIGDSTSNGASAGSNRGDGEQVQVAVAVDRTGRVASAVRALDGGVLCDEHIELCEGRVPDACRRVLGLPTAPPPAKPFTLLALRWADALAVLGSADPGRLTWTEALAARPFDPRASWTEIRLGVAADALHIPGISGALAAFMDDGMFAREALACSPAPHDLFEVLTATLPHDVLDQVVGHLEALADRLDL